MRPCARWQICPGRWGGASTCALALIRAARRRHGARGAALQSGHVPGRRDQGQGLAGRQVHPLAAVQRHFESAEAKPIVTLIRGPFRGLDLGDDLVQRARRVDAPREDHTYREGFQRLQLFVDRDFARRYGAVAYAGEAGCGANNIIDWPDVVSLAGWDVNTASIGYRDDGPGRVWLTEFDWSDGEGGAQFDYTAQLMGSMIITDG